MSNNKYNLLENLDEKYFSDILKLLLTTQGVEKGLRTKFANAFVKKVFSNDKSFRLSNSNIFREYPLNISKRKTRNIDLLFLDLDEQDNMVIGIENKYLSEDSENQLDDYYCSLRKLFPKADIKLVYLTLDGRNPTKNIKSETNENLVCLSWTDCILNIVMNISKSNKNIYIRELINILNILKDIRDKKEVLSKNQFNTANFGQFLEKILNEGTGNWKLDNKDRSLACTVNKVSNKNKKFSIKLNIAFYGKYYLLSYNNKNKLFLPTNINIEQSKNMLQNFLNLVVPNQDFKIELEEYEKVFTNNYDIENIIANYLNSTSKLIIEGKSCQN